MIFIYALAFMGLALLFSEFFLPGGIMAIGAALCLLASLYVFYQIIPDPIFLCFYFMALTFATIITTKIAIWRVKKGKGTIYLDTDQEGFQASIYPKELVGKIAHAATDLKPSGHIWVGDKRFQALSKTGYIDRGASVKILGGQGAHLIVKSTSESV